MACSCHSKPRKTRTVKVGRYSIGGSSPVSVQSMCNTDTRDLKATVDQIRRLQDAGCEIIRVAVPDMQAAENLGRIKAAIGIPLVPATERHPARFNAFPLEASLVERAAAVCGALGLGQQARFSLGCPPENTSLTVLRREDGAYFLHTFNDYAHLAP